jgi:Polysaccharide lyase
MRAGVAIVAVGLVAAVMGPAASSGRVSSNTTVDRHVFCFGDPSYQGGGWSGNGTSSDWFRQGDPGVLSDRVVYTARPRLMGSVGCTTVKAAIEPGDRDAEGGNGMQRAQIARVPTPELGMREGATVWYGDVFATNRGFKPHYDPVSGSSNEIQCFHSGLINGKSAPQAPIYLGITTIRPAGGQTMWLAGARMVRLRAPRLWVGIYGGNVDASSWPNEDGTFTARDYLTKTRFVPGRRYAVQFQITWSAHMKGAVRVWINGRRQLAVSNISNMWHSGGTIDTAMYPIFGNYRPRDPGLPTNEIYYGGLIVGPTRSQVTVR